ncbi:MAG: porphobilinogen synthase [Candidatus Omnitrophica bacterium]|nr:porphobilinogen synthase [Candidatus Omnitrophota bacterium]
MFNMKRLRRIRKMENIRKLFSETELSVSDFIMPYFVVEGKNIKHPIKSMPGVYRLSIDNLLKEIKEIYNIGIIAVLLFGISTKKDDIASQAYSTEGIVQKAVKIIKKEFPEIVVITDVCLCGYTTHGHCGIVKKLIANNKHFIVDNDKTLKILSKIALSYAAAGCDFVAPSSMMDGQVSAIREILDRNGFYDTGILAYSAKYASNFYGPFREALSSAPRFGDRKTYQMDFRNSSEALREIEEDIKEGADIVMVKPALAYLDIIRLAKNRFNMPIAAYNVSGEYALVKFGAKKGIVDEKSIVLEILTSIKRAGADLIISYHAKEVAKWLRH